MQRRTLVRISTPALVSCAILFGAAVTATAPEAVAKPSRDDTSSNKGKGHGKHKHRDRNKPPSISGSPPDAVLQESFYDFVPDASDADGDTLNFSIENKPAWANFDPTTGAFYGTPTSADVGRYESIKISVSDGKAGTSLPLFSIDVIAVSSGSVTLNWIAPVENTDGTTLTNLASYRIYYGTDPQDLRNTVDISNPSITTYVVENLSPATWHFAATAINSHGTESLPSASISYVVP